ncbi:hypothetical protein [Qipengyuania sp. 902]|uniref:hypothetical protein n=1 Tax=Qipengyuania sp. 902 TaxID=3417565 RepID=UPI003EB8E185
MATPLHREPIVLKNSSFRRPPEVVAATRQWHVQDATAQPKPKFYDPYADLYR